MLKSIFASLVEVQVESGVCFGDLFFDFATNEENNMVENKTIKQALNEGLIVQDDWSHFMLKLIYYVIQNDGVAEDSAEVLLLFHTISEYSYFANNNNKTCADFHKRVFIGRFLCWFCGNVKCVNYTTDYFQYKGLISRAEWIIWECLNYEKSVFRNKVQEVINENINFAKENDLPCYTVFLTLPDQQDRFFNSGSYFEEVK